MEPLTIGDLTLINESFKTGICFSLKNKNKLPFSKFYSKKISHWTIEIDTSHELIIVKTKRKIDKNNIYNLAFPIIQKFLDLVLLEVKLTNQIKKKENYFIWYIENKKQVLESFSTSYIKISSNTQLTVIKTHKNGKKTKKIMINNVKKYDESYRYYRLAQLTETPVQAFRNLYLSFEKILDSNFPIQKVKTRWGKRWEGEWAWTKRGLISVSKSNAKELAIILECNITDVADNFKKTIYPMRQKLFHSKEKKGYVFPTDLTTETEVIRLFNLLERIYLVLVDEFLGERLARGGMVSQGLIALTKRWYQGAKKYELLLSENNSITKGNETLADEMEYPYMIIQANSLLKDNMIYLSSEINANTFRTKFINLVRFSVINSGKLIQTSKFDKPIKITKIIGLIRLNASIGIISEDFHRKFK